MERATRALNLPMRLARQHLVDHRVDVDLLAVRLLHLPFLPTSLATIGAAWRLDMETEV